MSGEENSGHGKWRGSTETMIENHEERLTDHEDRLTRLEKVKYLLIGGLIVVGIMSGSAGLATELLKVVG